MPTTDALSGRSGKEAVNDDPALGADGRDFALSGVEIVTKGNLRFLDKPRVPPALALAVYALPNGVENGRSNEPGSVPSVTSSILQPLRRRRLL
jgi:hypothetical protein